MQTTTLPELTFVVSPFPTAAEPVWDDICLEWVLTDADGNHYCGDTPSICYRQFEEALHYLAASARKSGFSIEELRAFRGQDRDRAEQLAQRPY